MKFLKQLLFLVLVISVLFSVACDIIKTPSPEPSPSSEQTNTTTSGNTRIFSINGSKQICNPSISLDTFNFKGCMLWLNFSGEISVKVPDSIEGYSLIAKQHDRLTITDTSNSVLWFMSREEFGAQKSEELQDPEWTTHPHFINCLLSSEIRKKWSCFVIHTQTKKFVQMTKDNLNETSTPHIWINDKTTFSGETTGVRFDSTGIICKESVESFFGTPDVKLVYSKKNSGILSLYFVDFNTSTSPVQLQRPDNRDQYDLESALISPDGKWIAYNAYTSNTDYECYLQELRAGSKPILFKTGASDPHWWRHPADLTKMYIIFTEIPGGNVVSYDLSDPTQLSGNAGITYRQLISLFPGYSGIAAISRLSSPEPVVNLPLKGGWSPDGKYLCTGYERAYLVGI